MFVYAAPTSIKALSAGQCCFLGCTKSTPQQCTNLAEYITDSDCMLRVAHTTLMKSSHLSLSFLIALIPVSRISQRNQEGARISHPLAYHTSTTGYIKKSKISAKGPPGPDKYATWVHGIHSAVCQWLNKKGRHFASLAEKT